MTKRSDSLDMAVIGLLLESPLHGYELRKRLNLLLGWSRLLSYGSLYPALKKLLRQGYVTDAFEPDAVARRQRITYTITDAGREHFAAQMSESGPAAWEDDAFDVRFSFFAQSAGDVRLRVLEGRRARLQERLERIRPVRAGADRYAQELHRHRVESVERELTWLTGLIETERDSHQHQQTNTTPDK
ncbi:PadR family transcriptional regulator [Nocardioides mangrovicus]|uniref:PadR family transcriptional regulator n=1 Tax=Nocardioides mangrovicus TaxID=2478913 RepID=A0A3L8NZL1_9ACTN|nr:PadR family transcriptional regulator [Nocardioides mangrovicus]RLV48107.1 PadR family transcriptional regulator [Nocardioides mangrovicus]